MLLIRNSLINVSDIADVKGEEKMDNQNEVGNYINRWGSWGEPTTHTKYAAKQIKFTDTVYNVNAPSVLSIQDLEQEIKTGKKCATRISFEKQNRDIVPEFGTWTGFEIID